MTKTMKILSIILIIAMMFTFAMTTMSSAADIINELEGKNTDVNDDSIIGVGASIIDIITTVGIIISVIVLLILGIKYMMGSASEKAEYKKTMIPYLVGAVLIFGASAIAKGVVAMTQSITN